MKSHSCVMSAFMRLSLASSSALEASGLSRTMCFPVVSPSYFLTSWSKMEAGVGAGWGDGIGGWSVAGTSSHLKHIKRIFVPFPAIPETGPARDPHFPVSHADGTNIIPLRGRPRSESPVGILNAFPVGIYAPCTIRKSVVLHRLCNSGTLIRVDPRLITPIC